MLRRAVVGVGGLALILVGTTLILLPGPGLLTILAGLALLATEFAWARTRLEGARVQIGRALRALRLQR